MKTITWNGISSESVPGLTIGPVKRSLIGTPRGPKLVIPGRAGFIHFDQPPGSRKITVQAFIEGDNSQDRRDRFELLADWLDVQLESRLIISDTSDVFYLGTIEDSGDAEEWRQVGTFELVWEVQPYSYDLNPTIELWTSGVNTTHDWDPDLRTLVNPVIEVKPTNGTLVGFDLLVNGDVISYGGTVSSGSIITINSIAAVVLEGASGDTELTGAFNPVALSMASVSGQFPALLPGVTNSVTFQKLGGTATTIDIKVIYRKTYRK